MSRLDGHLHFSGQLVKIILKDPFAVSPKGMNSGRIVNTLLLR